MRELHTGENILPVRATPLTLLFYRQEFGTDMSTDFFTVMSGFLAAFPDAKGKPLSELSEADLDPTKLTADSLAGAEFDVLAILRFVWAMAKTAAHPTAWPTFESWLASIPNVDVYDPMFLSAALGVAADGLFRRHI